MTDTCRCAQHLPPQQQIQLPSIAELDAGVPASSIVQSSQINTQEKAKYYIQPQTSNSGIERQFRAMKTLPWRTAEAMHWQMGKHEMASCAGVTPFSVLSNQPMPSGSHIRHRLLPFPHQPMTIEETLAVASTECQPPTSSKPTVSDSQWRFDAREVIEDDEENQSFSDIVACCRTTHLPLLGLQTQSDRRPPQPQ
jgi:hypothetical protein